MIRLRTRAAAAIAATLMLALSAAAVLAAFAPEALDDVYETDVSTPLAVPAPGVLGNDVDADGDGLSVLSVVSGPAHGSLTLNGDGSFRYTPVGGYVGSDSFSYEAQDTENVSNVAEVRINVRDAAPPDPPACERVVAFVGQLKADPVTMVKSGHTLRVQVTISCDGHVPGLSPVLELHRGAPGSTPLSSVVMREKDGKYVHDVDVPAVLGAGETLTLAVRPLGAGTAATTATLQVRR